VRGTWLVVDTKRGRAVLAALAATVAMSGMALLGTVGAETVAAAKPTKVNASICFAVDYVDAFDMLVTNWSYSGIRNANYVREYGSTDGGTTWQVFDGRGVTGSSAAGDMYTEADWWNTNAPWTLVKVQVEKHYTGSQGQDLIRVLASTAPIPVALPVESNPAC